MKEWKQEDMSKQELVCAQKNERGGGPTVLTPTLSGQGDIFFILLSHPPLNHPNSVMGFFRKFAKGVVPKGIWPFFEHKSDPKVTFWGY